MNLIDRFKDRLNLIRDTAALIRDCIAIIKSMVRLSYTNAVALNQFMAAVIQRPVRQETLDAAAELIRVAYRYPDETWDGATTPPDLQEAHEQFVQAIFAERRLVVDEIKAFLNNEMRGKGKSEGQERGWEGAGEHVN